jgi:predicted DNA-binding transcriptional regulator AlpA
LAGSQGRNRTTDTRIFRLWALISSDGPGLRCSGYSRSFAEARGYSRKSGEARDRRTGPESGPNDTGESARGPQSGVAIPSVIDLGLEQTVDDKIDQRDVAAYLGVSPKTVRTLVKRGELPQPIRIGRSQFWLKDKFTRWLRDGGVVLSQSPPAATSLKLGSPRRRARSLG